MSDKRIIEEPASEEIFHDDWLVKDSPLNETTKIQASVFMALVVDAAKEGMVPYAMLATEWTALTTYYKDQVVIYNGELYRAKDTNVSPTFNPSAWTKISFDTLYRTTLANVKNSICEEWSTSGEYTLNDCAIHEDKLYKCVADTATVGTWVSNEWELVSIYEIIQNLPKSASDVTYDNTESGLESDNVQDALDEVVETITELSNTTEVTGTASGAIATFTDGADVPLKELKVAVTPYQDLHGYDGPWAGGSGKNKLPLTVESIKTASDKSTWNNNSITINGVTYEIQVDTDGNVSGIKTNGTASGDSNLRIYDSNAEFYGKILNGCPSNGSIKTYYMQLSNVSVGSDYDLGNGTVINQTDTGRWILIINIKNGTTVSNLVFKPMIRLASVTDATFEPYSNICPIIGWDEAVVTRCGKNLFDESILLECSEWTVSDGVYSGESRYVNAKYGSGVPNLAFKPNTQYTFGLTYGQDGSAGVGLSISIRYTDDTVTSKYCDLNSIGFVSITSTAGKTVQKLELSYGSNRTIHLSNMQLEEGSTATTYEPYNGATYTIDLDGTRYGGVVDATNGTMTVDRAYVDLGTLTWNRTTSYSMPMFYATIAGKLISNISMLCSVYKFSGDFSGAASFAQSSENGSIGNCYNNEQIFVRDDAYTDATTFKTAMSGVQLVYELATPITVQLAPTPVKSIEGENNISADCGDINNVEYVRNLNITINDLLSRING